MSKPQKDEAPKFVPLEGYTRLGFAPMNKIARRFHDLMSKRRTIRDFSPDPVPREIIERCIQAAGTAPSGANHQPWHFVAISDPETKAKIREAAEAEERAFYAGR